jgi:iron complex transport system ATP-binding protein
MPTLSTKNLQVGWDGQTVATIGDITLNCGEIVVLAGPNGCGKSTALKTIARQIRAIEGQVLVDAADHYSITAQQFARHVSYVPQSLDTHIDLTVNDLVALGRNPHQSWWSWQTSSIDRSAIEDALRKTDMLALRHKNIASLSGGERQRASIAMALAQRTQYLLMDEPTAHLDFRHQMDLVDLLADLRGQGLGILIVLHDLNLMSRLSDRIVLLKRNVDRPSHVAISGPPEAVLTRDHLQLVYEVEVCIMKDNASGLTSYTPVSSLTIDELARD